jgi:hypothetical protein
MTSWAQWRVARDEGDGRRASEFEVTAKTGTPVGRKVSSRDWHPRRVAPLIADAVAGSAQSARYERTSGLVWRRPASQETHGAPQIAALICLRSAGRF